MLMAVERDKLTEAAETERSVWYAVLTERQAERTVQAQIRLLGYGYRAFYPYCLVRKRVERRGRTIERIVERPYFSRYVFAGIVPWASYHPLFTMQGVKEVLRAPGAEKPSRIRAKAMAKLLALADDDGLISDLSARPPDHDYRVGDVVGFPVDGPFSGFTCLIQRLDKHGWIGVEMDIFGRKTWTDVHHSQLGAVQKRATSSADALRK